MSYGWEILIAVVVAFLGGYTGIAGGPFIVFLLSGFLGYSQHSAQGTVLAVMLGPITILPVIYGWDTVHRRKREIIISIISYMVFSLAGAEIAYLFDSPLLKLVFGGVIIVLGITYIVFPYLNIRPLADRSHRSVEPVVMALIGGFIGVIGGMVGIAAGIVLIPILTMGLGIEQREAQTMALAILMPPVSIGAVIKYGCLEGDVVWPAAGLMLLAYIISSGLGYRISARHDTAVIRTVLCVLLITAGIISIIGAIRT